MTTLHTMNRRRARKLRQRVYVEAKAFHEARVSRLYLSGRLDKLQRSGFIVRCRARERAMVDLPTWVSAAVDVHSFPTDAGERRFVAFDLGTQR